MIDPGQVAAFLKTGLIVWFALLAGAVALKMLQGEIRMDGIFRPQPNAPMAPERVAMFVASFGLVAFYFLQGMTPVCPADGGACSMPDLPEGFLTAFGGANAVYIAGKLMRSG